MKTKLLLLLTFIGFNSYSQQEASFYLSNLSGASGIVSSGDMLYVQSPKKIYKINTSLNTPDATTIYTPAADFYITNIAVIGNMIYLSEENYKADTDTSLGSRIVAIDVNNLSNPINVIYSTTQYVSALAIRHNHIYFSSETAPDANDDFIVEIHKIDISIPNPTATVLISNLTSREVNDMEFYSNNLLISVEGKSKVFGFDVTDETPVVSEYLSGLNSNKGIFVNGNHLFTTEDNKIVAKQLNTASSLATIAQNTTYKNTQDGASFNENFIDVALIGDTLYMTLKEEGKIVKATDNTLSNSNATVSIADGNFEQALIDLGFDTNGLNGNILKTDAEAITELKLEDTSNNATLKNVTEKISSLVGIEAMINLTYLDVYNNNLTAVDVSKNTKLITLFVGMNQLTALDVSKNLDLKFLYASSNNIKAFDASNNSKLEKLDLNQQANKLSALNIVGATNLRGLYLWKNELGSIDLSTLPNLEEFGSSDSELTALDISNNILLKRLWLTNNKISALDISNNKALLSLYLRANQLTAIDVSNNTDLEYLEVAENQLTTIDVSKNTLLERLYLHTNQITTVDVSNNPLLERLYLYENQLTAIDLTKNPLLKILWLENNQLSSVDLSNNPNIDNLAIGINPLSSLDVSNQKVMRVLTTEKTQISTIDLSANINLEQLWVAENPNLTTLDVSNNPKIWNLGANATGITELDLSKQKIKHLHGQDNTALTKINLASGFNGLVETMNLSGNTNLTCVQVDDVNAATTNWTDVDSASVYNTDCGYNQPDLITILDTNFEQALIDLGFDTNGLSGNILKTDAEAITVLKISDPENNELLPNVNAKISDLTGIEAMINLTKLEVGKNNLTSINVSQNTKIIELFVSDNQLTTVDVSNNILLERLGIMRNKVETFNVNMLPNLRELFVHGNQLSSINVTENINLTWLYASDNNFGTIDVSNNTKLEYLYIWNCNLSALDITSLVNLKRLYANANNFATVDVSKNTNLERLSFFDGKLTSLDITNNTKLEDLRLYNNQLTSIDVSKNPLVKILWLENNQLTSVDLSNNPNIDNLAMGTNPLTTLDVSNQTAMRVLTAEKTQISSIDLSANANLEQLWVAENPNLTTLDVSNNPKIFNLGVYQTNITELDLGLQPIKKLHASDMSALTKLNLKNTNNVNVTEMFLQNNPNLTCVQVDDVAYATSNWTNITDSSVFNADCGFTTSVAVVHIPDANMKNALLADPFINSNGDNEIQVYEAEAVHDDITRGEYLDISDLTGIEAFVNITGLNIKGNNLTSLDLSKNTKLKWVNLEGNKLASVDFSANTMLEAIYVGNNNLTALDVSMLPNLKTMYAFQNKITAINVSQNKNLETLWLSENELSAIDISANTELKQISLDLNSNISTINFTNNTKLWRVHLWKLKLTSIDVSMLPELARLYLSENNLTALDITKNTKLTDLRVGKNPITSLNVSKNTLLERIDIEDCDITTFDVSKNTNLKRLWVQENGLNGIDISNNTLLEEFVASHNNIVNVDVSNNYYLKKLLLDDNSLERAYLKNDNNTAITEFSINGNSNLSCIAVDNATWSTTNWTTIDAGASFSLDCSAEWEVYTADQNLSAAIVVIPGLDDDGDGVVTYEEAQAFTGDLDLSGKGITNATGLEAFSNARSINISGNDITDINKLLNGTFVVVASRKTNQKQAKSRAAITGLQTLDVSNNKIESIDISKLSSLNTLTTLNVSNNKLTSLKINNGHNNALTTLNATGNSNLTCIQVDNVVNANNAAGWTKDATANYSTSCQAVLSVDDAFLSKALRLYPNPVKDILNIELSNKYQIKKIQLFNVVGKLLIEKEAVQQLNVAQLPSGIYLLKVDTDKGRVVKKIMKK